MKSKGNIINNNECVIDSSSRESLKAIGKHSAVALMSTRACMPPVASHDLRANCATRLSRTTRTTLKSDAHFNESLVLSLSVSQAPGLDENHRRAISANSRGAAFDSPAHCFEIHSKFIYNNIHPFTGKEGTEDH